MIKGRTAYEAWKKALALVREEGRRYKDVRGRYCIEASNLVITVETREQLTLPIEYLQSQEDWLYPSLQEIAEVVLVRQPNQCYGYAYGVRLFHHGNAINQINDFIIPILKRDPTSRRAVAMLFDPAQDSDPTRSDVPGLVSLDFKIREGELQVTAFIRSNDLFIGWPANIYQLQVLLEYIAARLDIEPGAITTVSTSAHLFEEHLDHIKRLQ